MSERLHVVTGCMFAGKTTELMRLKDREQFAGNGHIIFKPSNDTRSSGLKNHKGEELSAIQIDFEQPEEILNHLGPDIHSVFIDEAQFFGPDLPRVVEVILHNGIRVYAAGLQSDFRHEGFGPMPQLLGKADNATILSAVCTYSNDGKTCGQNASRTQRLINGQYPRWEDPIIVVGAQESYAPRCPNHHVVLAAPYKKLW